MERGWGSTTFDGSISAGVARVDHSCVDPVWWPLLHLWYVEVLINALGCLKFALFRPIRSELRTCITVVYSYPYVAFN